MGTCIITGASKGIGRAIAIKMSHRDDIDNLVLMARSRDLLEETKSLMNPGKNITFYAVDLTDFEVVPKIVKEVYEEFGSIDSLFNVMGYANPKSLLETDIENLEDTYRVNVFSLLILTREVVKYMKNSGGRILNVASTAGMTSRPGWVAYASSKAAVISLSETLSNELADYGILVFCISPGRCATELRRVLAPDEDQSTIMQPEQVADVVNSVVFEQGVCLDGQNIIVRKQV